MAQMAAPRAYAASVHYGCKHNRIQLQALPLRVQPQEGRPWAYWKHDQELDLTCDPPKHLEESQADEWAHVKLGMSKPEADIDKHNYDIDERDNKIFFVIIYLSRVLHLTFRAYIKPHDLDERLYRQ